MRRTLAILLLILALVQFGAQSVKRIRHEVPLWDFASVYAAARTWVAGGNPYDVTTVIQTWKDGGVYADRPIGYFATVYPPNSLVMLVPFAVLPHGVAMIAWLAVTIVLLVLQFAALFDMAKLRWFEPLGLLLIGGALASAPYQFGILSGQLSIPTISLCIIAFWCVNRNREILGGVLLGLACALKPQVGAPFVAYYILLRHMKVSLWAILVGGVICAGSVVAMKLSHIDWLPGWKQSVALTAATGGVNDYGWTGEFRDEIVDLKMLLVSFLHDTSTLRIAVEGVVLLLGVWYVAVFPRGIKRTGWDELLVLAGLSALALLPIYHRVYDIALLTTAFAWALSELDGPRRKYAIALLIPMVIWLMPFDSVEPICHRVPGMHGLNKTAFWQTWLAPLYAWGLLAVTIGVLWTMSRMFCSGKQPAKAASFAGQQSGK